jgi:hypothetical protein
MPPVSGPQPLAQLKWPKSILIWSSCHRLSVGLISSGLYIEMLCAFLIAPMRATLSAHLILLYHCKKKSGEEHACWSSSLRSFPQSSVTSSLLGPNIFLSTLFSNTLSLWSLNVKDRVSNQYETTGNLSVLYMRIFKFLRRRREGNTIELYSSKHFAKFNVLEFFRQLNS